MYKTISVLKSKNSPQRSTQKKAFIQPTIMEFYKVVGGPGPTALSRIKTENIKLEQSQELGLPIPILTDMETLPFKLENMTQDVVKIEGDSLEFKVDTTHDEDIDLHVDNLNLAIVNQFQQFISAIITDSSLRQLLYTDELDLIQIYYGFSPLYQYILCRLFTRIHDWHRASKFFEQIDLTFNCDNIERICRLLTDNGCLETDYLQESCDDLLNLLTINELHSLAHDLYRINNRMKKNQIIATILKQIKTQKILTDTCSAEEILKMHINRKLMDCLKLSTKFRTTLMKIYSLSTYSNRNFLDSHDYFKAISVDSILDNLPQFSIETYQVFNSADEFNAYFKGTILLKQLLDDLEVGKNRLNEITECANRAQNELKSLPIEFSGGYKHLERFTASYVYTSILSRTIDFMVAKNPEYALNLLDFVLKRKIALHRFGWWIAQKALVQSVHLKDHQSALELILKAYKQNGELLTKIDRHVFSRRLKVSTRRSYKVKIESRTEAEMIINRYPTVPSVTVPVLTVTRQLGVHETEPGRKRNYIQYQNDGSTLYLSVEQVALDYYRRNGYPDGLHCEGRLICAIFSLFLWDIIYGEHVNGVFISKLQFAPLDLYSKHFFDNRKQLIKQRLKDVCRKWTDTELWTFLQRIWDENQDRICIMGCKLSSVLPNFQDLRTIIECIGRSTLVTILLQLSRDYSLYSAGFPDFILWNPMMKHAKFVEVKSERDQFSVKQVVWINFLRQNDVDVEICRVYSTGSKPPKQKIARTESDISDLNLSQ